MSFFGLTLEGIEWISILYFYEIFHLMAYCFCLKAGHATQVIVLCSILILILQIHQLSWMILT